VSKRKTKTKMKVDPLTRLAQKNIAASLDAAAYSNNEKTIRKNVHDEFQRKKVTQYEDTNVEAHRLFQDMKRRPY